MLIFAKVFRSMETDMIGTLNYMSPEQLQETCSGRGFAFDNFFCDFGQK